MAKAATTPRRTTPMMPPVMYSRCLDVSESADEEVDEEEVVGLGGVPRSMKTCRSRRGVGERVCHSWVILVMVMGMVLRRS